MDSYVTGAMIKRLREAQNKTQSELAEQIGVSDKAVSKWETGKGLPDISMIQSLAEALGVSVIELMSGENVTNRNKSCNIMRSKFYVCSICGNIIHTTGEVLVSCCGVTLPMLEAEDVDEAHRIQIEDVEDEYFLTVEHSMSKEHYISFVAHVTSDRFQMVKLYPEGNDQTRLILLGRGLLYLFCNRHGLMRQKL